MRRCVVIGWACIAAIVLASCSPEDSAGGVDNELHPVAGNADGSIYNAEDVPDLSTDIDPDQLKSHQTCALMLQCADELCKNKATPGCDTDCIAEGSKAALAAYTPYGDCRREVCAIGQCGGSGDPACVNTCVLQKCSTLLFHCNAEGKSGAKGCDAMVACHKSCSDTAKARKKEGKPGNEFVCLNTCYGGLGAEAQTRYDAWAKCYAHSKAKDPYAACLVDLLTCGADGGHGEGTCAGVAACVRGCEMQTGKAHDFQSCIGGCYGAASETAQTAYKGIISCHSDLAEGVVDAAECSAALVTCGAPAGDLGCKGIATCVDECNAKGQDNACAMTCMGKGSAAGAAAYGGLLWCSLVSCEKTCKGKAPCMTTCQAEHCKDKLAACVD